MVKCTNDEEKDKIFDKFISFFEPIDDSYIYVEPCAAGYRENGTKTSLERMLNKCHCVAFFNSNKEYNKAKSKRKNKRKNLFILENFRNWIILKDYLPLVHSVIELKNYLIYYDPFHMDTSFISFIKFLEYSESFYCLAYIPLQGGRNYNGEKQELLWKKLFGKDISSDYNCRVDTIINFLKKKFNVKLLAKFIPSGNSKHRAIMLLIYDKNNFIEEEEDLIEDSVNIIFEETAKSYYNGNIYGKDREEELLREKCPICGKDKKLTRLTCCDPHCRAKYSWSPLNKKSKLKRKNEDDVKDGYHKSFGGIVLPNDDEDKEKM